MARSTSGQFKKEIDEISKRIHHIMKTIKELDPIVEQDPLDSEDHKTKEDSS